MHTYIRFYANVSSPTRAVTVAPTFPDAFPDWKTSRHHITAQCISVSQHSVVSQHVLPRRHSNAARRAPRTADDATRLLLLGEVLAVADFDWDNLYVEFMLRWDPEVWDIAPECGWEQCERGVVRAWPEQNARGWPGEDAWRWPEQNARCWPGEDARGCQTVL
eukprot:364447-Chlamydomonas_euryale.AAC.4